MKDEESIDKFNFSSPEGQKLLLEKEAVTFIGDYQVELAKHRWSSV